MDHRIAAWGQECSWPSGHRDSNLGQSTNAISTFNCGIRGHRRVVLPWFLNVNIDIFL